MKKKMTKVVMEIVVEIEATEVEKMFEKLSEFETHVSESGGEYKEGEFLYTYREVEN